MKPDQNYSLLKVSPYLAVHQVICTKMKTDFVMQIVFLHGNVYGDLLTDRCLIHGLVIVLDASDFAKVDLW